MFNESVEKNVAAGVADEVNPGREENFAVMLDQFGIGERLHPGQKVKAKVISISGDFVYIDLGGKSEGAVDLAEFADGEGKIGIAEGDTIDAFFVSVQDGTMKLTTLVGGYSAVSLRGISDAFEAGVPVNGEVKREIKGGFEVSVGGVRCFCPFSHIDLKGGREGGLYPGLIFPFKVLEFEENGKKVILSRRVLLEEERQEKIAKLKETLSVGMDITGEVKSVLNFGAFADLGGIEGLIPASEMSWDRSVAPSDVLSAGQHVTARIISLDWEKKRLTLSLKALAADPWGAAEKTYTAGSKVNGTIMRLSPFGAFVRLEPGIDGLVHISNLGAGRRINHPKEVVETGQAVEVYVLSVDPKQRRISLSMQPKVEPVKIVLPAVGESVTGKVEKVMPFGVFVKLSRGANAMIPTSELGMPSGSDPKQFFTPGKEVQAQVSDVDSASGKVRLSRKAVLEKVDRDEVEEYREDFKKTSGSLGSLGDILRAKFEEKGLRI